MYRCLKKYCEQLKLPTPNASTFGQKLKEMTDWVITGESIYDTERKTKFAYWRGIAFNDDSPYSPVAIRATDNSIPLNNEENKNLKNKNENFRTQGLDKKGSAYTHGIDAQDILNRIKTMDSDTGKKNSSTAEPTSFQDFSDEDPKDTES
jgi:hypothetical protein